MLLFYMYTIMLVIAESLRMSLFTLLLISIQVIPQKSWLI